MWIIQSFQSSRMFSFRSARFTFVIKSVRKRYSLLLLFFFPHCLFIFFPVRRKKKHLKIVVFPGNEKQRMFVSEKRLLSGCTRVGAIRYKPTPESLLTSTSLTWRLKRKKPDFKFFKRGFLRGSSRTNDFHHRRKNPLKRFTYIRQCVDESRRSSTYFLRVLRLVFRDGYCARNSRMPAGLLTEQNESAAASTVYTR